MSKSVRYLYKKLDTNPEQTSLEFGFFCDHSAESFIGNVKAKVEQREVELDKKLNFNNYIQHTVLSFHQRDKEKVKALKQLIIADFLKEFGIDKNSNSVNIFIHEDKGHPHIHILSSRINEEGLVVSDNKLRKRLVAFSNKMNKEYRLTSHSPKPKMTITQRHFYNPTARGKLLELIDYAQKNSKHLPAFQAILKNHGVHTRINQQYQITYFTKNSKVPDKEEVPAIIENARQLSKGNSFLFYQMLAEKSISLKIDKETQKEIFSLRKVRPWTEDVLPPSARMKMLYKNIHAKKEHPQFYNSLNAIKEALPYCRTIEDIEKILPNSVVTFDRKNKKIFNIQIHTAEYSIRLHEAFPVNVELIHDKDLRYNTIPIIFKPRDFNGNEEEKQQFLTKKNSKKHYQIGFKNQL